MKKRTKNGYRAIDLTLFAVMLAVFESIIVTAATKWFPNEPYTVSLAAAVTAIVMVRWGPWAAIHAVIGGLVFCTFSGAGAKQYAIYCIGNLFSLGALIFLRRVGWEKIQKDALTALFYGFLAQLLMHAGRAAVSVILGAAVSQAAGFFTTDIISYLFTLVLVWIARHPDGLMEDQTHYLLRVSREEEEDRRI